MSDLVLQAAAIVTATGAVGTFGGCVACYRLLKKHDRVLFGEDGVEHWGGIIAEVRTNKRALEDEGLR